ncbi:META domain-containing protein [Corynebacterium mendelii]|uniref:META domain-containing protein n=1 Tax=Corynebacterium mendelii TaxID=2765362 RepID=A0A939IWL5_9CORY|nr:META domain-containing protein [Corynebacterium mendelii]MBN9643550.1 META domain-containing protein [Corynebacterium mendelii]
MQVPFSFFNQMLSAVTGVVLLLVSAVALPLAADGGSSFSADGRSTIPGPSSSPGQMTVSATTVPASATKIAGREDVAATLLRGLDGVTYGFQSITASRPGDTATIPAGFSDDVLLVTIRGGCNRGHGPVDFSADGVVAKQWWSKTKRACTQPYTGAEQLLFHIFRPGAQLYRDGDKVWVAFGGRALEFRLAGA